MTIKQKIIGALLALVAFLGGGATVGSVTQGSEYQATTTSAIFGVAGTSARRQVVISSNQSSVLGSIVVASTTNAYFKVWNATSTTDIASSTITTIATSTSAGTYTFDANITRGIIIDVGIGFNGEYTVTYRP